MFPLFLAVLSSSSNMVVMRISQAHITSPYSMLAGNYIMCFLLSLFYLAPRPMLPQVPGLLPTAALGLFNGFLFLGGFVMVQRCTRENGVVLTSIFSRLGVLVPTVMAITLFGETPTLLQLAGIALALFAILFMNGGKQAAPKGMLSSLLLLLLFSGGSDGMAKVYEQIGTPALADHFLLFTFFFALVYNLILVLAAHEHFGKTELLFGLLLGVPNYFVARFHLQAVAVLPAVIVYPTFCVGTILVTSLIGMLCFREKLSRRQIVSFFVILLSLVCLNL